MRSSLCRLPCCLYVCCSFVVHVLLYLYLFLFFFYCSGDHRDLHSFPTRRSSDLRLDGAGRGAGLGRSDRDPSSGAAGDRKSTRLNSSHVAISYAVFCLKKKKRKESVAIYVATYSCARRGIM